MPMQHRMPVQVTKNQKETSQNLVHRFTKTVRQSGVLLEIRKGRFYKRAKSALIKKRAALKKIELKAEKLKAEKLAKPK
jgi:ribosomal protein S21